MASPRWLHRFLGQGRCRGRRIVVPGCPDRPATARQDAWNRHRFLGQLPDEIPTHGTHPTYIHISDHLLTGIFVDFYDAPVYTVEVIKEPQAAIVAMGPIRSRLLALLASQPASATQLANVLEMPRQKVNYHLRALERHGLVELAEERPRRGVTERVLRASASVYLVSPGALGDAAADPETVPAEHRLSAHYLAAVAARAVGEVGDLLRRADRAGRALPSLTIDTEIRFRSAAERAAFADDVARAVAALASRYHDESAPGGRRHRLVVLVHPRPAS